MKTLSTKLSGLFAATLLIAAAPVAQAFIEIPGAFAPNQCAVENASAASGLTIQQVCVGRIMETAGQKSLPAVSFRLSDGSEKLFQVDSSSNLFVALASGDTRSVLHLIDANGSSGTMKLQQTKEKHLVNAAGAVEIDGQSLAYSFSNFNNAQVEY